MTQKGLNEATGESVTDEKFEDYSGNGGATEEKGIELSNEEIVDATLGGFEKPTFEKNTKGKVTLVKVIKAPRVDSDSNGKKYEPIYLQVETTVGDITTVDNYGGIRRYVDDGFWWVGEKSAAGLLKKKVEDILGKKDITIADIKVALTAADVQIKTEKKSFQGKEYVKNIIQAIITE